MNWATIPRQQRTILAGHGAEHVIAVRPSLVKALRGNGNAAILLSQFLYWAARTPDPDGWFYNTQARLQNQTGLGPDAQKSARRILKAAGFLEEKLTGSPARLHYRLHLSAVAEAVSEHAPKLPAVVTPTRTGHAPKQEPGHAPKQAAEHAPKHKDIKEDTKKDNSTPHNLLNRHRVIEQGRHAQQLQDTPTIYERFTQLMRANPNTPRDVAAEHVLSILAEHGPEATEQALRDTLLSLDRIRSPFAWAASRAAALTATKPTTTPTTNGADLLTDIPLDGTWHR